MPNAKIVLSNMTVDFDRTAECQGNQNLTELDRILKEYLGKFGFDRTLKHSLNNLFFSIYRYRVN